MAGGKSDVEFPIDFVTESCHTAALDGGSQIVADIFRRSFLVIHVSYPAMGWKIGVQNQEKDHFIHLNIIHVSWRH
jgi:hypothetical protein